MAYGTTTIPNLTDKSSLASTDELVIRDTSAGEDKKFSFGSAPLESGNDLSDLNSVSTALGNLSLAAELQNLTSGEIGQLENIGSTTISSGQWSVLGGLAGTLTATELNLMDGLTTAPLESGNDLSDLSSVSAALGNLSLDTALQNLTSGEIGQLENIGSVTITNTQWGFIGGMNAQPIEPADSLEAADGTAGSPGLFFTGDNDVGLFRPAAGAIAWSLAGAEAMRLDGSLFLGDTANSNMGRGLTIDMQGATGEIFSLQDSSAVSHSFTGEAESDVFASMSKLDGSQGALRLKTFNGTNPAGILVEAFGTGDNTAKSTIAGGQVLFNAFKDVSGSPGQVGANGNLLVVRNGTSSRAALDAEGEWHLDATVSENAWDEYDDVALLDTLRGSLLTEERRAQLGLDNFVREHREVLENTGVVTYNEDGHHFIATKGMMFLTIDAVRQLAGKMDSRVGSLEDRLARLEAAQA